LREAQEKPVLHDFLICAATLRPMADFGKVRAGFGGFSLTRLRVAPPLVSAIRGGGETGEQ